MERQLALWLNYETLGLVARARSIEIVDLTRAGFLDVFPREEYEAIILGRSS